MLARCRNPNNPSFKDYGARGIRVCERWLFYDNFVADMGERTHGLTLERIDNDGHYTPSNCRWATRMEQNNNKRSARKIAFGGANMTMCMWDRTLGFAPGAVRRRLKRGWSVRDAILRPADPRGGNKSKPYGKQEGL